MSGNTGLKKSFPSFSRRGGRETDYLIFTKFISPAGVVDFLFFFYLYSMKNKNLLNRKNLKFFRSSLRNKSSSAEAELWNILKSKKT
jgi:hypothetical protein